MSDAAAGPRPAPGRREWLIPHPAFPSEAIAAISVVITREGAVLSLSYTVEGALDRVFWPEPMASARTDELWMHTCFEAFVQPVGEASYTELNLSPSGRWATYRFDQHRAGMRNAAAIPELSWRSPTLVARVELDDIADMDWRLGLTAVIEAVDGSKSFWALEHSAGPPDFHNADCFIAHLPAPDRA